MSTDFVFFCLFLAVTLAIGVWNGRNVYNIKQYALGDKNFSTGALVATIVATWIGGDYLFITLSEVYTSGLHYAIGCLGMAVCLLLNAFIFAPRMKDYLGNLSVAEAMGRLYGKNVRLITAIASTIAASGFIALQFKIFGFILSDVVGLSGNYPIILAAVIVVLYSAFGGIKSVTITDVFQFITFGVLLPVLGAVIWYVCLNDPEFNLSSAASQQLFDFNQYFNLSGDKFWSMLALFLLFAIPDINPAIFQRFAIGQNVEQVRRAFAYAALLVALILIAMSWISFLLLNINTTLDPNELVPYIIANYTNDSLRIFIMLGVVAMCMSSADSNINTVSVILTHDFCNVLNFKIRSELFLSKIIALLLGGVSVYLAMLDYDLLPLVFMTQSFYIPIIDVPLILAILGFKSSTRSVLIGMSASLVSVFIWRNYFMDTGVDSILPATFVNLVFFMASHYLLGEPGGWKKNQDAEAKKKCSIINTLIYHYDNFNFTRAVSKYGPKNTKLIVTCGIFCGISTICSMYSISNSALSQAGKEALITIYETMLAISVFFIAYPIWPEKITTNRFLLSILWNLSLCYVMIFCNSLLMLLGGITESLIIILILNILALAVLVNWRNALVIIVAGLLSSFYLLHNITPNLNELNMNSTWIIFYSIMLSLTIIVMFLKPKQEYIEETEAAVSTLKSEITHLDHELVDLSSKVVHYSQRVSDHEKEIERLGSTAQRILNNVNHELRLPIGNVVNFADMLNETLQKSDNKLLQELSEEVFKNSTRVSTMILNMLDLATLQVKKVDLQKKTINFGELVEDRVKSCRKIYLQEKKIDFKLSIQPEIMIALDPNYIRQMVDNIVINAISYSNDGLITVTVYTENSNVVLTVEDQGVGIPSNELYDIFDPFKMGSKTESKAEGRGIGLALCKSVAEAHDGSITAQSDGKKGAKFTIILPL